MSLYIQDGPSANAGDNLQTCELTEIQITGTASNYSSVLWTGGGGTFNPTNALTTKYTPTAAETGTTILLTLTAYPETPYPDSTFDVMDLYIQENPVTYAGVDDTICQDQTYTLADATAEHYTTILWTGGNGTFNNDQTLNPTYTPGISDYGTTVTLGIEAFATSPCIVSATDDLELYIQLAPIVFAGDNDSICQGDSYTISDATAENESSILWTGGQGSFDNANLLNPTYTPNSSEYGTTVTLGIEAFAISPCIVSVTDAIDVFIQPELINVSAGDDLTTCEETAKEITGTATNSSSVQWESSGNGDFNPEDELTTIYTPAAEETGNIILTLTANAINPCELEVSENITLFVQPKPGADAGAELFTCRDEAIEISGTAQNSSSVEWTGGLGTWENSSTLNPTYTPLIDETSLVEIQLTAEAISPCDVAAVSELTLTLWDLPETQINGQDNVCRNSKEIEYWADTAGLSHNTVYNWTIEQGAIIAYSEDSARISVNWRYHRLPRQHQHSSIIPYNRQHQEHAASLD